MNQIGYLNVLPNSNPLGIKRLSLSISISFIKQIQYAKNLNSGRFELVQHVVYCFFPRKMGIKIITYLTPMGTNLIPDSYSSEVNCFRL